MFSVLDIAVVMSGISCALMDNNSLKFELIIALSDLSIEYNLFFFGQVLD
jgi:hypothetical protein